MVIHSVFDEEFAAYGRVWSDAPADLVQEFTEALAEKVPLPDEGRVYLASDPALEELPGAERMRNLLFGGAPTELGRVAGTNTRLNALEYHRCSEFNLSPDEFILMLGRRSDIHDGKLDTSTVKAFRVPSGTLIEVFATSMHFAPAETDPSQGFRVMVALPSQTNGPLTPELEALRAEGGGDAAMLWGVNKWFMAHPDSPQAVQGAYIGLVGENFDLAE